MNKKRAPGAQPGNSNAYKGGRTSRLVVHVTPGEKAGLVRQATGPLNALLRRKLGLTP